MKNRYARYIAYSLLIMAYGVTVNALSLPDFYRFNEWSEFCYRSREQMITMFIIGVGMGTAIFLFGLALLAYSIRHHSQGKKELLGLDGVNVATNLPKMNRFESGIIMFLILSTFNLARIFLTRPLFK